MTKFIIYAFILVFLLLAWKEAKAYTPDQWVGLYQRDCQTVKENHVCKQRLEKTLSRAFASRLMVLYYLKKHSIPSWVATVPIIESQYLPFARSEAGAVGLWQFMPETAVEYGLKNRNNPIESTKAACRYLDHLYIKYGDWKIALMAYNAGEDRIDDFLDKKGPRLTFETMNYYPQIMALQKIIDDITTGSKRYGFHPISTKTHFKRYAVYALFLK